jgi:periplasmic divalent cation tolerance protein
MYLIEDFHVLVFSDEDNPSNQQIQEKPMTDCSVILVTTGSQAEGERIAEALVGERLAACVNIVGPIRSVYRWEDAVQRDDEWLLIIKAPSAQFAVLADRVRALHSYQTPEVIALPITAGSDAYLDWLRAMTQH